jgi:hypothetical protein
MFTGITTHAGSLITAIVVLTGAAILRSGAAGADPNQDDQFLALLNKEDVPALEGVPSLIATAHKICRNLDGGMPVDSLVDAMMDNAYDTDPSDARLYPPARLTRTFTRFITAAVEAYCPHDQGKIASIMANPAPGSNEPTHRVAAYTHNAVNSGSDLREPPPARDVINMPAAWQEPTGTGVVRLPHMMDGGVFVAGRYGDDRPDCDAHGTVLASLIGAIPGEVTPPSPPQIPAPPLRPAQTLTPPRPIAAPPPPKEPPPPPQQPPPPPQQVEPPPQQVEPPAVGPQPGGAAGSGGSGSTGGGGNGGGGPAEPSPTPPMPPGIIRVAP